MEHNLDCYLNLSLPSGSSFCSNKCFKNLYYSLILILVYMPLLENPSMVPISLRVKAGPDSGTQALVRCVLSNLITPFSPLHFKGFSHKAPCSAPCIPSRPPGFWALLPLLGIDRPHFLPSLLRYLLINEGLPEHSMQNCHHPHSSPVLLLCFISR